MEAIDTSFASQGFILSATLLLPDEVQPCATVVMVHGTGPLDRDENMEGQELDIFNTLADALAQAGIASIRYDKRGCGQSQGDYTRTGFYDLADDVCAAISHVRETEAVRDSAVYVLGHSEGTLLAPLAAQARKDVAGLILLSPAIAPIEAMLIRQAEWIQVAIDEGRGFVAVLTRLAVRLMGGAVKCQMRLIRRIQRSKGDKVRSIGKEYSVRHLREILKHRADEVIASVNLPMLVIAGGKDIQCESGDATRIAELAPGRVQVQIIDDLTHVLRCDKEPPSFNRYDDLIEKPVDQGVIDLILEWLDQQNLGIGDMDQDILSSFKFEVQQSLLAVADCRTNQPSYATLPNAADAESALHAESFRNRFATTPLLASFPPMRPSSASAGSLFQRFRDPIRQFDCSPIRN